MLITASGTKESNLEGIALYKGPYKEILPQMREDGFKGVELHILDSREIDREELWKLLADNDLKLTSIGTGTVCGARGYNLIDPDPQVRKATILHLEEHMKTLAPSHGVVIIGLIAQGATKCPSPLDVQKMRLADSLRELDELAAKHGVKVGLEMMNYLECQFLHTIGEGIEYLDSIGHLEHTALHIDMASMNISEADIGAAIRAGKGRICHVHATDNDRYYAGHGHYNFRETLRALKDIGYDGALALEHKPYPDPRTAAKLSLQYLQTTLNVIA